MVNLDFQVGLVSCSLGTPSTSLWLWLHPPLTLLFISIPGPAPPDLPTCVDLRILVTPCWSFSAFPWSPNRKHRPKKVAPSQGANVLTGHALNIKNMLEMSSCSSRESYHLPWSRDCDRGESLVDISASSSSFSPVLLPRATWLIQPYVIHIFAGRAQELRARSKGSKIAVSKGRKRKKPSGRQIITVKRAKQEDATPWKQWWEWG